MIPVITIVKELALFILALLFLIAVAGVAYIVYRMIFYKYPRVAAFGHSEPYETYLPSYLADLLNTVQAYSKSQPATSKDWDKALALKCRGFLQNKLHGHLAEGVFTAEMCTAEKMPALHMYFIYKEAIENPKNPQELVLYKKFFGDTNPYGEGLDSPDTKVRNARREVILKDIKQIHAFFEVLKLHAPSPTSDDALAAKLSLLASYRNNMFKAFDFRKTGGAGNTKMFQLLMQEYVDYVWVETLPPKWKNFGADVKATADYFIAYIQSDAVANYMARLPATIGGLEGFENSDESKPQPLVEHFGFLKALMIIPQFFIILFKTAKAIALAITQPLKAFRLILGLFVGTMLYILYVVVSSISILFYIPAFLFVLAMKIWESLWWILIFIIVSIVYVVLWLLDYATGGIILPLFRCENLPTSWYTQPGFFLGNKYKKGILCGFPCNSSYSPSTSGGSWCEKQTRHTPPFCPQQLIYQYYEALLSNADEIPASLYSSPIMYEFKSNTQFLALPEIEKKEEIRKFLDQKYAFLRDCHAASLQYKKVQALTSLDKVKARANNWPAEDAYGAMCLSVCEMLKTIVQNNVDLGPNKQQLLVHLKKLCRETYCTQTYSVQGSKVQVNPGVRGAYNFCPFVEADEKDAHAQDDNKEASIDILSKLLLALSAVIFVVAVGATMYKHINDDTLSIIKAFGIK